MYLAELIAGALEVNRSRLILNGMLLQLAEQVVVSVVLASLSGRARVELRSLWWFGRH